MKLSEKNKKLMMDEYLNNLNITVQELCEKYKTNKSTFYQIKNKEYSHLTRNNLVKCNENFFSDLNIEKPTYWAGFILGDGHINKLGSVVIHISEKDIHHLEKFKSHIESDGKITVVKPCDTNKINKTFGLCSFSTWRLKISNDLEKHGITKDKSKYCTIPKTIPENMLHHFMRGVFDADGCITFDKKCMSPQFVVVSSVYSFCEEYQEILVKNCDLNKTKISSNKNNTCFSLKYGGNLQVKRIMDYLYKDATVYLERKYDKFQQHYVTLGKIDDKKSEIVITKEFLDLLQ